MGTRYPGRPATSNQGTMITFRLDAYHTDRLNQFKQLFKLSTSAIMREALSIWFNLNSKGVQ